MCLEVLLPCKIYILNYRVQGVMGQACTAEEIMELFLSLEPFTSQRDAINQKGNLEGITRRIQKQWHHSRWKNYKAHPSLFFFISSYSKLRKMGLLLIDGQPKQMDQPEQKTDIGGLEICTCDARGSESVWRFESPTDTWSRLRATG